MPRPPRIDRGGLAYHVSNRGAGRKRLFKTDADYAAFESVLAKACRHKPGVRLLGYSLMPTHFHLVLWPDADGQLSAFMRWLTVTYTQRRHAQHRNAGTGPMYQGRYRSFPIQPDEHLQTVVRYVERNALRAGLAKRAESWRYSSLWQWLHPRETQQAGDAPKLSAWPTPRPRRWRQIVNTALTDAELSAVRNSVCRGAPYGDATWANRTARRLQLQSSLRPIGRPRKHRPKADK